jgi:uncharacterized membrane protein
MSDMPPPPPPGQPAQPPMGGAPSAVGSNKKTYTILAYVFTWIGGLIFLFVGKDDADVRWNSANSLIVFGGLTILDIILAFIPFLNLITIWLIPLIGLGYWIYFLVKSIQGNGERIPAVVISPYINQFVDQLANAVK